MTQRFFSTNIKAKFEILNYLFNQDNSEEPKIYMGPSIIDYYNAETDKSTILTDNKGKAGVYQWKHRESGKIYIGSAVDLSKRLKIYYSPYGLKRVDNYISRAIILHGHSAFSLSILEYINISHLSKDGLAKKTLILEREQHYLDILQPEYNILKIAGSSLGFTHSEESLAKRSGENHYMF